MIELFYYLLPLKSHLLNDSFHYFGLQRYILFPEQPNFSRILFGCYIIMRLNQILNNGSVRE